jgi:uncharacterized repeat protein (TIGR04138 family)
MTTISQTAAPRLRYHTQAYHFVFAALRHTQQKLGRAVAQGPANDEAHISGPELLAGVRELAVEQFGLLTRTVFRQWGIESTDDFGRMVFELVERGEMRKTDRDRLSDFFDVYDFDEVFDRRYRIDTRNAFKTTEG